MLSKICSAIGRGRARKPASAGACVLVNQFATPGLGSLMGGRVVAGSGQLFLAILGFGCFTGWFVQVCARAYRQINDLPPTPERHPWLGPAGVMIFGAAWLWAWVTSISLLREARRNKDVIKHTEPRQPPKIHP